MPPVWKEIAVTEAKESLASHHSGKRDAVSGMNPFMGLRISPQPLDVPGTRMGYRGYPDMLETCPAEGVSAV